LQSAIRVGNGDLPKGSMVLEVFLVPLRTSTSSSV
jgi:hypothetical protein